MAKKYPPKEILSDFLLNKDESDANIAKLQQYLCSFDPANRKNIINAHLEQHQKRTSIHLAASNGKAKFLQILLEGGGEIIRVKYVLLNHLVITYVRIRTSSLLYSKISLTLSCCMLLKYFDDQGHFNLLYQ